MASTKLTTTLKPHVDSPSSASVDSDNAYENADYRKNGFQPNSTISSKEVNTSLRAATVVATALVKALINNMGAGNDITDALNVGPNVDVDELTTAFTEALKKVKVDNATHANSANTATSADTATSATTATTATNYTNNTGTIRSGLLSKLSRDGSDAMTGDLNVNNNRIVLSAGTGTGNSVFYISVRNCNVGPIQIGGMLSAELHRNSYTTAWNFMLPASSTTSCNVTFPVPDGLAIVAYESYVKNYVSEQLSNYALKTYVSEQLSNYALKTYVDNQIDRSVPLRRSSAPTSSTQPNQTNLCIVSGSDGSGGSTYALYFCTSQDEAHNAYWTKIS